MPFFEEATEILSVVLSTSTRNQAKIGRHPKYYSSQYLPSMTRGRTHNKRIIKPQVPIQSTDRLNFLLRQIETLSIQILHQHILRITFRNNRNTLSMTGGLVIASFGMFQEETLKVHVSGAVAPKTVYFCSPLRTCCVAHLNSTCGALRPCFFATAHTASFWNKCGVLTACSRSISTYPCGPKELYAVTTIPSD